MKQNLVSEFSVGESVNVLISSKGKNKNLNTLIPGTIKSIMFDKIANGKVSYDIKIDFKGVITVLENIDSALIIPMQNLN